MCQKQGQRYSESLALCRRLGDQCDVLGMTPDEIMCTCMVTLCTDDELRSELMKPEAPTVAKLTQIIQEYERSQAGKAGLGLEGAHALAASSGARPKPGKNADKWEKKDKCKSCGRAHKYPHNECTFFKASCHHVERPGISNRFAMHLKRSAGLLRKRKHPLHRRQTPWMCRNKALRRYARCPRMNLR